jgi:hypothetical protein
MSVAEIMANEAELAEVRERIKLACMVVQVTAQTSPDTVPGQASEWLASMIDVCNLRARERELMGERQP